MKKKYFFVLTILTLLSGCQVEHRTEPSKNSFSIYDYLEEINSMGKKNDSEYRIVEQEIFDLSTEGGNLIAIYTQDDLEYLQFASANSTNTFKYEFSLFDDFMLVSKVEVTFAPADTAEEFSSENMQFLDIKQHTYLISSGDISNLSGNGAGISDDLKQEEKVYLLNLFTRLLEYIHN